MAYASASHWKMKIKVFGIAIHQVEEPFISRIIKSSFKFIRKWLLHIKINTKKNIPIFIWKPYVDLRVQLNQRRKKRIQENEDKRVSGLARFTSTETLFLEKKLRIIDNASYEFIRREIFNLGIYKFSSANQAP